MKVKRLTNKWAAGQIKSMKAKEGYVHKKIYEALHPHFIACGRQLERVACIRLNNGKCYFLRNACLKLKTCVEVENSIEWREEQKEKIKQLRESGFKVFFVDSRFTGQDCTGLVLAVVRHLSKIVPLKDGKRANEHSCLYCHRYYDVSEEACGRLHHHVNIWDKACIYFSSEGLVPDVCAEPQLKLENVIRKKDAEIEEYKRKLAELTGKPGMKPVREARYREKRNPE